LNICRCMPASERQGFAFSKMVSVLEYKNCFYPFLFRKEICQVMVFLCGG
jgi:hypothetical protein